MSKKKTSSFISSCLVLWDDLCPPPCCTFTDSKVITCLASSAIKWQVHSPLMNAEARTPAISSQEGWNVLNETLQNKHTAVHGCGT